MPKSRSEQFDSLVDVVLAQGDELSVMFPQQEFAPMLLMATGLRALPRENFKATLKADLIRRATMGNATATNTEVELPKQTAIPSLCFRDAARAIEFYKQVFGAEEGFRLLEQEKLGVAQIRIGNTQFLISREAPEYGEAGGTSPETLGGSTVRFKIMVADADATASRMLAAGGRVVRPVADQFYGDRAGQIADPFGYTWIVATHKEDVSTQEMQRRLDAWTNSASGRLEKQGAETKSVEGKMASNAEAKAVPYMRAGFRTITPYILVGGAAKFIDFLKAAFGAEEKGRVPVPGGKIMHAEVKVGDSMLEMSDGNDQYGPSPVALHYYVDDVDAAYARAIRAGAISTHAPIDQPYGDREAGIKDPFGNSWFIATPKTYTPFPGQMNAIQVYLFLRDAEKMIPFLESAFGAKAEGVHKSPEGTVAHATIRIGNNTLEFSEAHGPWQPSQNHLHLYVPDTDAVYAQALRAGATTIEAPSDKPYGDRSAGVKDPWGNSWFIATHIKDVAF